MNHGDNKHNHFFIEHFGLRRLMLFATQLEFVHPYSKQTISISADLGEAALAVFAELGWPNNEKDYK